MLAGNVSLGALRIQAQQRADLENSPAISTPEWNQYLSQSRKRLFDMLVGAYGNDYKIAPLFYFNTGGYEQYYPLPNGLIPSLGNTTPALALYKLIGVDLQYAAAPTGWVTLKRFEEIERNQYAWPNTAVNFLGITNLKYRLSGDSIEFIPSPMSGQTIRLKYIPVPKSLQFLPTCGTTLNSAVITTADASDITVGMSAYGPGIPTYLPVTVTAVDTTVTPNQITISSPVMNTAPIVTLAFWTDAVTIDGIAGWEEYVVIDAAIKARVKQEQPIDDLRVQKAEMVKDIQDMAEGRDAGQAHHVSDVLSINGFGGDYDSGWGQGGGGYGI
jgi:hypothetical protein